MEEVFVVTELLYLFIPKIYPNNIKLYEASLLKNAIEYSDDKNSATRIIIIESLYWFGIFLISLTKKK